MTSTDNQSYYVPDSSPLAVSTSVAAGVLIAGIAVALNGMTFGDGGGAGWSISLVGLVLLTAVLFSWFRTTIVENRQRMASAQLKRSYVLGIQWFIFSEICFFAAFFGSLFYVRNLVGPWLGGEGTKMGGTNELLWQGFQFAWPMQITPQDAVGINNQMPANNGIYSGADQVMHWNGIPLINTLLLLSSSVTVHIAHHALKAGKKSGFNLWLAITLLLGFAFVGFQVLEYHEAYNELGLTLKSGIYGSTFFILTGFHGFHVCMGAIMLSVQWLRSIMKGDFTADDHFGFEAASWYWHFVDVVWVGLFLFVYIF